MAFTISLVSKLFGLVCIYAIRLGSSDAEHDSGDGYGTEWMWYYADNGDKHMMNFSVLPSENEGWVDGFVHFYLFSRSNPNNSERLHDPENRSQYFNASRDTKVLTHGWLSSGNVSWIQDLKKSYLDREDLNVIIVDWSELSGNPVYPWPAVCSRYVGKRLARLLDSLVENYNATGTQMHLTGHSLGAQVMGFAGMFFSKTILRITGLDPARPLFEIPPMSDDCRLDKSDAAFVDIVHTCGGGYGYEYSHGHADFYPNGGKAPQPGCTGNNVQTESCSHGRATEFFDESLHDGLPFTSYPCESYQVFEKGECKTNSSIMGEPVTLNTQGNYYLHTRNETPYSIGNEY